MKFKLEDLEIKDGRYYYTFTPNENMNAIELLSDCFGTTRLNKIQIEKNADMTYWVPPEVYEGNAGGLFENLNNIKLQLLEPDSEFWGQVYYTARGILKEYHNGTLSAEFMETAGGIETRLRNSLDETKSEIKHLSGLIEQRVTRGDLMGIIQNSGDAIMFALRDKDVGKMSGEEILSAINITTGGIYAHSGKNKLVITPDTTYIEDGTIKSAMIDKLSASQITTGELNAALVRIVNLDVKSLTGFDARLVQAYFNAINSSVEINGNGIVARHNDGSYTTLGARGLYTTIGGTNYQTHYLHDVITVNEVLNDGAVGGIGVNGGYYWVNLPSIYRGKKFKAFAVPADTLSYKSNDYAGGNMKLLRVVCYVKQELVDYVNARVPLIGYAHVYEESRGTRWNYPVQAHVFVNC